MEEENVCNATQKWGSFPSPSDSSHRRNVFYLSRGRTPRAAVDMGGRDRCGSVTRLPVGLIIDDAWAESRTNVCTVRTPCSSQDAAVALLAAAAAAAVSRLRLSRVTTDEYSVAGVQYVGVHRRDLTSLQSRLRLNMGGIIKALIRIRDGVTLGQIVMPHHQSPPACAYTCTRLPALMLIKSLIAPADSRPFCNFGYDRLDVFT
ncbi:hypothetical protein H6P81_013509 [Aristolochia fimbriata]|uniref:Uncharacterized protein n=1 Tax=Aristolochia fimbriata TaxID=158543 RepID=A0AAV7EG59_ARIFI|nr:hypothetical protein H6P81_013509 [Aristolochia fimbriata]